MQHFLAFCLIELLTNLNTIETHNDIKEIKKLLKKEDTTTLEKHFNANPTLINEITNRLQKRQEKNMQLQTTLNTIINLQKNKKTKAKL